MMLRYSPTEVLPDRLVACRRRTGTSYRCTLMIGYRTPERYEPVPRRVVEGVRVAGWGGVVLPRTRVSDYRVFPVVEIDSQVWEERIAGGHAPELDRSTLRIWESWTTAMGVSPPRPAVAIVGFVSTAGKPTDALNALDSLSGYGSGLWLTSGGRGPPHGHCRNSTSPRSSLFVNRPAISIFS